MTRSAIFRFLRNIVSMSPRMESGGINAFAVYNYPEDVTGQATKVFGKTYGDFLSGFFWSRDWVATGADENKMIGDYPVLMVQNTELSVDVLTAGESNQKICGEYAMIVAAPLKCDGCDREYNSAMDVEDFTFAALSGILSKFNDVGYYSYTDAEGNEQTDIFTAEMLEHLLDNDIITDETLISNVSIESDYLFQRWGEGTKDKLIGWVVTVSLCVCEDVEFEFSYNPATWAKAVTRCNTCP